MFCFENNHFQPVILGENRWSYDVRAIYEDREGNLWLGTSGGGLAQLRPQSMHVLRVGQGLPAGSPTALTLAASGRIYVAMQRDGLFAGESGRFERMGGNGGLAMQNFITSVAAARDGTVWIGTMGNGLSGLRDDTEVHLTTANGLADDSILSVLVDESGAVWASTAAGTVHRFAGHKMTRFDNRQGLPGTPVTVLIPAAAGGLWAGTQEGQILREQDGKFSEIKAASELGHHSVLALCEGAGGRLWIGTAGGGLTCLTKDGAMNWNTRSDLPSNIVAGIVEDAAKNLWLATDTGIYRVNQSAVRLAFQTPSVPLVCKLISDAKTMPVSSPFFGGSRVALSPEGELWFATADGVLNVDTRQSEVVPPTFPVYLENVALNGAPPISLLQGLLSSPTNNSAAAAKIPVDLRSLEFHYAALNYMAAEDLQFRHKLEGLDADWVNDAGVRSVHYGPLVHGRYRFRVAARNVDGAWQEAPEPFSFVVPTPFYLQSWAVILYCVSSVALVTGIVRMVSHRRLRSALARLEQQQSVERERMRIARDMHDEMGSKLTKISFLSEHAQMDAESTGLVPGKMRAIAQTSRELLKTMDEIVWVVNPRNDTLENLVTYLGHYAIEYFQNTPVECDLRLAPEIPHYPLSSELRHNLFLTFEEALNNVLKHSGAARVQIDMIIIGAEFQLKVADNGHGFSVPKMSPTNPVIGKRGGNGLQNMRQRLTEIGGECLIASQPETGTIITIRIPIKKTVRQS